MYDQFREDTLFCMLYAAVTVAAGHWLDYIYGSRAKAVWSLAARQLCRFGAQGGVAGLCGAGNHSARVRYLCIC